MNITKIRKWLSDHKESIEVSAQIMNINRAFLRVNMRKIILAIDDPMERFISELTYEELKRSHKNRDWYYLVEVDIARQKVKEELFL